jgi:tRNA nucleotidyltransferase (CCA-adding enzyme)
MRRRDFTINTLAISLNPAYFGELLDFFKGSDDIKRKLIRVLHDLSFIDDPTRVFRAVRFEQRLDFRIESSTEKLVRDAVTKNLFDLLADYRVFSELRLILQEKDPLRVLKRLEWFGILSLIRPRIESNREIRRLFTDINKQVVRLKAEGKTTK